MLQGVPSLPDLKVGVSVDAGGSIILVQVSPELIELPHECRAHFRAGSVVGGGGLQRVRSLQLGAVEGGERLELFHEGF